MGNILETFEGRVYHGFQLRRLSILIQLSHLQLTENYVLGDLFDENTLKNENHEQRPAIHLY